ncbi:hypothetical protein [Pontibacter sp. G13]|uniref:hypothetical protein n=1 Tax=Pontibacter sp. G13 TaxID=3074898 RepID=UPI00288B85B2|nr:hypothetical protein [Pontibacter sp. G13]WNJ16185.1 hypothetical protein RJD25_15080 [Pontibacter sp. G13]
MNVSNVRAAWVACLMLSVWSCQSSSSEAPQESVPIVREAADTNWQLDIKTTKMESPDHVCVVEESYPKVSGMADAAKEKAINKLLKPSNRRLRMELMGECLAQLDGLVYEEPARVGRTFEVVESPESILSVAFTYHDFYPNRKDSVRIFRAVNIDMSRGEMIRFADCFQPTLQQEWDQITPKGTSSFDLMPKDDAFVIGRDSVYFYGEETEAAGHTGGIYVQAISLEALNPYLKETGPLVNR